MAIHGVTTTAPSSRRHIIVSAIEHKSVLEPAQHLTAGGWRVTVAPVHHDGRIDLDALAGTIGDDTALVSVMAANNEIGVLQPLAEIAALAHARGSVLHVDAAQAAGKVPIDVHKDRHRPALAHRPQNVRTEGLPERCSFVSGSRLGRS